MAKILYIPFSKGDGEGDLRVFAETLVEYDIQVRYRGGKYFQVGEGDLLIVNAHGAKNSTAVYDNGEETTTLDELLDDLKKMKAAKAHIVVFFICFSAQSGHVAEVFKEDNPKPIVYGYEGVLQGSICKTTRRGIWGGPFSGEFSNLVLM